jgi:polyferredoxin
MKGNSKGIILVICFGLLSTFIGQLTARKPVSRNIHIRNFRYGKDPYVIRCNRGDTLHLTFSSDDTGHSFFLEEFDVDAKVRPSSDEFEVFRPSNPSASPLQAKELTIIARHSGILNFLVSKSYYRCHVWCGPMHAFEQGKLVIMPNTLLLFSLGCLAGLIFVWLTKLVIVKPDFAGSRRRDITGGSGFLRKMVVSRWPQLILTILTLIMIYIVIITGIFGTKVSGRNLGVLLMWAVWLFLLVTILTPLGGRLWCSVCPLPLLGDWLQRGSVFSPVTGKTGKYNNIFSGLFLKWPEFLSNNWLKLFVFLILATFSTTLVASPRTSGITVLFLLLVPSVTALVWEHRAFCRYLCPVSVFISPFSDLSPVALRSRSAEVCDKCKGHFCNTGNSAGWPCPYGLTTPQLDGNTDCGLCLECTRSCIYDNVSLFSREAGNIKPARSMSEAWTIIAIFTTSVIYSILYLGQWPAVRDYVNILDKNNWDLFLIYSLFFWVTAMLIVPGLLYGLAAAGAKMSGRMESTRSMFLSYCGTLLPLGLSLWIAFVIPMLFVNITFLSQAFSDPFGWGWDFFGTANIPWRQFMPRFIPWIQAVIILISFHYSLRNSFRIHRKSPVASYPVMLFLTVIAAGMIVFFVN